MFAYLLRLSEKQALQCISAFAPSFFDRSLRHLLSSLSTLRFVTVTRSAHDVSFIVTIRCQSYGTGSGCWQRLFGRIAM
jgi:hypothetical protein